MSVKRIIQISLVIVLVFASLAFTSNASASGYCSSTYVVQPGDWLAKIARRCGVTLSQMYAANPGVGSRIYPGQVVYIPGGYDYGYTITDTIITAGHPTANTMAITMWSAAAIP